jgi:hypothetical protein
VPAEGRSPDPTQAREGLTLAKALEDVDVQSVWRFLREHNVDLAARKSWCETTGSEFSLSFPNLWTVPLISLRAAESASMTCLVWVVSAGQENALRDPRRALLGEHLHKAKNFGCCISRP